MNNRWTTLEYLQNGTPAQQEAFALLNRAKLLDPLVSYHPILVGTIPIGIEVPGSDLDIICEVKDMDGFARLLEEHYHRYDEFELAIEEIRGIERIVAGFTVHDWPVEIYGENKPTFLQNGFLHMVVEDRLLKHFGSEFRQNVIRLKRDGLKTEPAFAKLLGLAGDPYAELLKMSDWNEAQWADYFSEKRP